MHVGAETWRAQLVGGVARRVRHYRLERGLSVQKVADICTETYGLPMKRTVLANFEAGRRPALSVVELLVLARILKVPPALLLFPLGREETIEILPGQEVSTEDALKWFGGHTDWMPGAAPGVDDRQDAEPIRLFREHDRYVAEWRDNLGKIRSVAATMTPELMKFRSESAPRSVDEDLIRMFGHAMGAAEDALRAARQEMRTRGLTPPPLEPDLAHIEEPGPHAVPLGQHACDEDESEDAPNPKEQE